MGEASTLSFSIALAALRGSFGGIFASHYILEADRFRPIFVERCGLLAAIDIVEEVAGRQRKSTPFSQVLASTTHSSFLLIDRRSFSVLQSKVTTDQSKGIVQNLSHDADARRLDSFYLEHPEVPTTVIFFQCPWSRGNQTAELIVDFITSASWVQRPGDFLVIGLCTPQRYFLQCGWESTLQVAHRQGYRLRGRDSVLVNMCFRRGIGRLRTRGKLISRITTVRGCSKSCKSHLHFSRGI